FLERSCQLGPVRRRAADQSAQEPPRPVDAQEPDLLQLLAALPWAGGIDPREQFGAERALPLRAVAARLGDLLGDLLPHLVPQTARLGRGERLQLERAVPPHDRDPDPLVLGHVDLDVNALPGRDEQASEVHPLPGRVATGPVEGPGRCRTAVLGGTWLAGCGLAGTAPAAPALARGAARSADLGRAGAGQLVVRLRVVVRLRSAGELGIVAGTRIVIGAGVVLGNGLLRTAPICVLAAPPSEHPARSLLPCRKLIRGHRLASGAVPAC